MARRVKALLLAAGLGSRLRPLTDTVPKCLVPVAGRPLLAYWLDRLGDAGVAEAVVNTHALSDRVRDFIAGANRGGPIRLVEAHEPTLLGSAGTVAANPHLADDADEVLILYADNLSDVDLRALLAYHRAHDDPATMLLFRAPDPRACGIAELDDAGRVVSFVEKPAEPRGDLANAGVYVLDASAYREVAALGAFDLGFDVLPRFVGRMRGWAWGGYHRDIGTPEALAAARADFPTVLAAGRRPAVFLDRDGTIIEHVPYLADPARVRLLPGVAEGLRRLGAAGFVRVVVSNQSVIGRGMATRAQVAAVHDAMRARLAEAGAAVDAIYDCPVAPRGDDRTALEHPDRKPGPGMLLRAASELGLDLGASWMIGDMISDALAGINAGCRGSILVRTGKELADAEAGAAPGLLVRDDFATAAEAVLAAGRATRGGSGPARARGMIHGGALP
ncbi:MAG TPA: HAD-IIIA family hydrolase [Isosphaeraceae bacterium]|jgi:D,D-heptose 1,7-bisphosphate phosphatase|nr:HAD-IIIA family hydrolase [Isosphaeraceae bacterium]